jgi:hypothetical protein
MRFTILNIRLTTILTMAGIASSTAAAQPAADSSVHASAVQVYRLCEKTADPLVRAAFRFRAHLGMWPIEEDELKSFLAANSSVPPPASWAPCMLTGSADGCVVSVRITEVHRGKYFLSDSAKVHLADAKFYLTAESDPKAIRASVTGELRSAEIITPDGRMVLLPAFSPGTMRMLKSSASAPDSVLFVH